MPIFRVTDDDEQYGRDVDAHDAGEAVEEWAGRLHAEKDYPEEMAAICTDTSGEVTRWSIEVRPMPVFTAYPAKCST